MSEAAQTPRYRTFWQPRYWPTWLALAALRVLALLPYPLQRLCGYGIGLLLYCLPLGTRRIMRTNLELCFPEKSSRERARLLRENYDALGMSMVEIGMSWWSRDSALRRIQRIDGLEHLQAALAQGKGALLVSAHFTTLELGGRLLRLHTPFHVLYREQNNRLFDAVMQRARTRNYEKAIHRNDIKSLLQSLRENRAVWYAPDQNFGGSKKIFVPFFGVAAATNPATSRLVKASGTRIVPFYQVRLPGIQGYRLVLLPALEEITGENPEADTARINAVLEQMIREAPGQYLWAHRRFKTRPPGETETLYD